MYLTRLSVQGFRSLKDITWEPGNLNLVIGPNGSGKSNLLKLFDLSHNAINRKLSEYIREEGGFDSIRWDNRPVDINVNLEIAYKNIPEKTKYAFIISKDGNMFPNNQPIIKNEELISNNNEFFKRSEGQITLPESIINLNQNSGLSQLRSELFLPDVYMIAIQNQYFDLHTDVAMLQMLIGNLQFFSYIDTSHEAQIRQPQIVEYTKSLRTNATNLVNVLHTLYMENRDFKNIINQSMSAAFGEYFDELIFPPASDQRVQMRIRWKSLKHEQSTLNLSDGTLRFLLLITVLANPEPKPLIMIDELETGLHPSMMPIIAELAVEASKKSQIIFTTHSDQFLDAFGETRPTTTVAKWEDGQTKLHIVDDNELKNFLKEYSLGALFRSGELESDFLAIQREAA